MTLGKSQCASAEVLDVAKVPMFLWSFPVRAAVCDVPARNDVKQDGRKYSHPLPFEPEPPLEPAKVDADMSEPREHATSAVDRRALKGVALIAGLTAAQRAELERACNWRRYRHGERLFERGSPSNDVFFIVEGSVSIVSASTTGRDVSFARASAGEVIGEMAAIDGMPRSASVTAAEDSLVAVLPAKAFIDLLRQNADIAIELLRRLSTMVRHTGARVVEFSSLNSTCRVYSELLRLAKPDIASPDLWTVKPLPPLRELAESAGTTRELVNNALNALYPKGLIRRRGNTLYLLDRSALEAVAKAAEDKQFSEPANLHGNHLAQ